MIERSYTTPDGCKITAYLERDAGDWSVGIPAGWSEDTCVVLEFDKCRVTLTWTDYDPEGRPIEAVEDYLIDFVDVEWNGELLADRSSDLFDAEPLLSLSELPEVLRVVQVALEAWNALERLTAASEALVWAERVVDAFSQMRFGFSPPLNAEDAIAKAADELASAKVELACAALNARNWGVL